MSKTIDEILAELEKLANELRASRQKKETVPHRRIGRYVEFSRREIVAWVVDGCPKDAQEWAEKYRARNEKNRR